MILRILSDKQFLIKNNILYIMWIDADAVIITIIIIVSNNNNNNINNNRW